MYRTAHLCMIAAAATLTACDNARVMGSEGEIEAIAHDAALDATAPKFSELQQRVEELEAEVERLSNNDKIDTNSIEALSEHDKWQDGAIETLYDNDRTFAARTGLPFQERQ